MEILSMQNAMALAGPTPAAPDATPEDDWLSLSEADLGAMHAEAMAMFHRPATEAMARRTMASLALLHQLVVARAVVRALGIPSSAARAAMRKDHALGYFFGLASGAERAAMSHSERQVACTLMMLHDLVYGRRAAQRITAGLNAGGARKVGAGFADGMMAAFADLMALGHWKRGEGGSLPGGLLDGLPWPAWARERAGERSH